MRGPRRSHPFPFLALGTVLFGCNAAEPDGPSYQVFDSAGVEIVVSHSETGFPAPWRFSETPAFRIGKGREEDPYLFTYVVGAVRLTDGSIVVREGASLELRRYDSQGNHIASFGGKGEGPGEFTSAWGGLSSSGDTLRVLEYGGKSAWFSPDGDLVGEAPGDGLRPGSGTEYRGDWWGVLPDGTLWGVRLMPKTDPPIGVVDRIPIQVVVSDPGRTEVRVLGDYEGEATFRIPDFQWYRPNIITRSWLNREPAGILVGDNGSFTIDLFAPTGAHLRRMKYPGGVKPPEQWQLEGHRASLRQHVDARSQTFPQFHQWLAEAPDPETWPGFLGLVGDELGYVWAIEYVPTDGFSPNLVDIPETIRTAIVFHPDGFVLGRIKLPADLRVLDIGENHLLGVDTDSLGVQEVVLYELFRG